MLSLLVYNVENCKSKDYLIETNSKHTQHPCLLTSLPFNMIIVLQKQVLKRVLKRSMHLYYSIFILLLLSAVKLSINVNVSVPLAALYVQAITEPAPCLTDEVLCCSFFSLHISLMEADSCFTSQWIFLPRLSFFFFSFFLGIAT